MTSRNPRRAPWYMPPTLDEMIDGALFALSEELKAFQKREGLPEMCALEQQSTDIEDDQRLWLQDFSRRWDAVYETPSKALADLEERIGRDLDGLQASGAFVKEVQSRYNVLARELDAFQTQQGLPKMCAFEQLHESYPNPDQRLWLANFHKRWEALDSISTDVVEFARQDLLTGILSVLAGVESMNDNDRSIGQSRTDPGLPERQVEELLQTGYWAEYVQYRLDGKGHRDAFMLTVSSATPSAQCLARWAPDDGEGLDISRLGDVYRHVSEASRHQAREPIIDDSPTP